MSVAGFETGIFVVWVVVAGIGALLAGLTLRAGARESSRPLLALGGGLLLVGVAAPVFWMATYVMTDDLEFCSFGTAALIAAGFVVMLYSIRTRSP